MDLYTKLTETADYLRPFVTSNPKVGVVLGSGLGNFVQEITIEKEIPYEQIPNFPVSTVEGHHGKLIIGTLEDKPVLAMFSFL
jgi:purine-nucleoside phosphorylase